MFEMNGQKRVIYEFDNFRLDVGERRLLRDGRPVTLSAKAFELLLALVENNGRLLAKEDLYRRIWRDQVVEESNLTVQMSALRRALGESRRQPHYIDTVIGSGYRFTADIAGEEEKETRRRGDEETEGKGKKERSGGAGFFSSSPRLLVSSSKILVVAALLLTTGFSGYWLYRNRAQSIGRSAAEPSQQMTLKRVTDGRQLGAPTISPDGKFIAYVENTFVGAGSLFIQQLETSAVRQLLEPDGRTFGCVDFSPDGALIYYIVFDERDPYAALYSVPILGGSPKRVTGRLGTCFALSPDGKRIAFYRGDPENNRTNLVVAAAHDGSGERILMSRDRDEWSHGLGLAWSPDGKTIAVFANLEVKNPESSSLFYGIDTKNGALKPLTAEKFSGVGKMSWASDGRRLFFVGKRPGIENQLYLMEYPSGEVRRVTNDLESYGNYGLGVAADSETLVADIFERKSEIWSLGPDGEAGGAVRVTSGTTDGRGGIASLPGERLAYVARTGNSLEIRTTAENGSETKTLTTDSFTQKDVTASPDGRYLVFASDQTGESHLFRMNAEDGSEVTQLTFGDASDSRPDISPDGRWVVYNSSAGGKRTIWRVPLAGGTAVQLTGYDSGGPVFAPDGKTIAGVLPSDSRARPGTIFIISSDGGAPLKSFPVLPFKLDFSILRWTPDGRAIVFDRGEKGIFNLWQQPLDGEAPRRLTNFQNGRIWNFVYTTDRKRLLIARGETFVDVVLIKNFR
jgi:Tol biopolymer transport system component/DNA-binding winged helix-turn-helix (wHTH) protein